MQKTEPKRVNRKATEKELEMFNAAFRLFIEPRQVIYRHVYYFIHRVELSEKRRAKYAVLTGKVKEDLSPRMIAKKIALASLK